LLRVLGIQARPIELHRFACNDPSEGLGCEESIEYVEADVPAGRTHRYETPINVVPEREARAISKWLELPSHIVAAPLKFEQLWGVSARHARLGDLWCRSSDCRELDWADRAEASVSVERGPFTELRWVRQRLPNFRRPMV
jgi:hypothetical protein